MNVQIEDTSDGDGDYLLLRPGISNTLLLMIRNEYHQNTDNVVRLTKEQCNELAQHLIQFANAPENKDGQE